MSIYKLSKDYAELYSLICNGCIIACFVDYKTLKNGTIIRDLAKVERKAPFYIEIGVRGSKCITLWNQIDDKPEFECFVGICKLVNLEYIKPY